MSVPRSEWIDIGRGPRLHVLHRGAPPDGGNRDDGAEHHNSGGGGGDEAGGGGHPAHLLVHGLASNAHLWDGVAAVLADAGRRVAAVDLRGHGRSDKPDEGYDMASVADDVAALIEALGWSQPVVAGQSWGANVVVELAARHPHACAAIACVDGGTISLAERFADFDACWVALAPPAFPPDLTLAGLAARLRKMHPDWPDSGIHGALACFEERDDATVAPWLTRDRHRLVLAGLYDHTPQDRFPHIEVPLLFIPADSGEVAWTNDKREAIDRALAGIADGRVRWFSPADHDVHAQHPREVAQLLLDLADEVRGRRPEGSIR